MENQTQQNVAQLPLPNSTAILVLGIISIALCWCIGIVGIALGVIALVMSGKTQNIYLNNPSGYTTNSYNNAKAGKICAIIGLCLSALALIYYVIYFLLVGTLFHAISSQYTHW